MTTRRPLRPGGDDGIAAIWVAASLLFILGMAALSVDVGGFMKRAYDEQRAGDFACLAGVSELPGSHAAARTLAAGYLAANIREVPDPSPANGFDPTEDQWDLTPYGIAWMFDIDPGWGTASQMRVAVRKFEPTTFGRVLGVNQVTIDQAAYCENRPAIGGGLLPIGVSTPFTGGTIKFSANDCTTEDSGSGPGVCNFVDIPRADDPPGTGPNSAPQRVLFNMWLGANQDLTKAVAGGGNDILCGDTWSPAPCNVLEIAGVQGNKTSRIYDGLIGGSAKGSSTGEWLGRFEYGDQPAPFDRRDPIVGDDGDAWTQTSKDNVWNTNLLGQVADCATATGGDTCTGSDDPLGGVTYVIEAYDCRDRRFMWLPEGEFFGSGANQQFRILDFVPVYVVDPIPADTNGDGKRDADDATAFTGGSVDTISAVRVAFAPGVEFKSGADACPTAPTFPPDLDVPRIPILIEGP